MLRQVKEWLISLATLGTVLPMMFALLALLMGPWLLNGLFQIRQVLNPPPRTEHLVVIALDQSFGENYAFPDVTPRDYLARLVRTVAAYRPRVIALDYKFVDDDRQDSSFADFVQAVAEAGNVVLPGILTGPPGSHTLLPIPTDTLLAHTRTTGYALLWGDPVRRMRLQVELADGRTAPSFALAALAAWHVPDGPGAEALDWDAVLDSLRFPLPGTAPFFVNYQGSVNTDFFNVYASETFLASPDAYADLLRDKLVLIGSTYSDAQVGDAFHTPFGEMRGVEVHANIIQNLLSQRYFTPAHPGPFWTLLFLTILCVLLTLLFAFFFFRHTQTRQAFLYTTLFLLAWSLAGLALFVYRDVLLPFNALLIFGFAGLGVFSVAQRRKHKPRESTVGGQAARVLLVLPDPSPASRKRLGLPARNLHYEAHLITTLHAQQRDAPPLSHDDVLQPATEKALTEHAREEFNIVHVVTWPIRHDGRVQLVLDSARRTAAPVEISHFRNLLRGYTNLQALVLDASGHDIDPGVRQDGEAPAAATAAFELPGPGLPAVVFLPGALRAEDALCFAQAFYAALAAGGALAHAVTRARIALVERWENTPSSDCCLPSIREYPAPP